jgi:hypothetical protein
VQSSTRGLLDDTTAVQAAVDSNPAIGGNILVSGVVFEGSAGTVERSSDDSNTAKIVGGVVGGGAVCLALVFILMGRRSRNYSEHNNGNDEDSCASHSQEPTIELREQED